MNEPNVPQVPNPMAVEPDNQAPKPKAKPELQPTPAPKPEQPAPAPKAKPEQPEQPAPAQNDGIGVIPPNDSIGTIESNDDVESIEISNIDIDKLKALLKAPFNLANAQGKYSKQPKIGSSLMWINSELAEAHDAYANERHANSDDVEQCLQFLSEGKTDQFLKYFKAFVKSSFEDELADIILMTLSVAGYYNVDLAQHLLLKHQYNILRTEHSAITKMG